MTEIATLDQQLNDQILGGHILEAFEAFYADDVVMQENGNEPRTGKGTNREYEKQFLASVKEFHGADVVAAAASGDVSFAEWWMDITFQDGSRKRLEQVAVRKWRDGKVVHERFYYDSAG
ncbi:MAG: nuclear transport factor 2 family protein [Holophagales bacterium]|nr:nuclear transport factor 2 family protein [Holophagales bacterium]